MGKTISNALFCIIILSSLPTFCNLIMAILYTTTSSVNALIQLDTHWPQISNYERKEINSLILSTVLQASVL